MIELIYIIQTNTTTENISNRNFKMRYKKSIAFFLIGTAISNLSFASIKDAMQKLNSDKKQHVEVDAGYTNNDRKLAESLSIKINENIAISSDNCDDMRKRFQDALEQEGNLQETAKIIAALAKKSCDNLTKGFDIYTVTITAEKPNLSHSIISCPHIDFYTGKNTISEHIKNAIWPTYRSFHNIIGEGTEYAENHSLQQQLKFAKTFVSRKARKESRYVIPESSAYPYISWKKLMPGSAIIGRKACRNGLIHKKPDTNTKVRIFQVIDYEKNFLSSQSQQ